MNNRLVNVKSLIATTKESSRTLSEFIRAASNASTQSSSTLAGVGGGLIGLGSSYGLTFFAPFSIAVVGPIFSSLGIVLGILLNRGRSRLDFERKLEENRIAADEIMNRIKALPRDAPKDVRDGLWATYKTLNSMTAIANSGQQALPPPSAPVLVLGLPNQVQHPLLVPNQRSDE